MMNAGKTLIIAGKSNPPLAERVASEMKLALAPVSIERFPDRELHIELRQDPEAQDVFLLQSTGPPPDEHVFELLALADACRRADAARITAVIPYFGYARQDRRAGGFEAVTARLVADLLVASGIERLVTLDLHTDAIEGFFTVPMERLTAVALLADAIEAARPANGVIVAPDLGAAKLAERYADLLDLPVAIVHKTRTGPEAVIATRVTGDVRGRRPIVVDDMISTGATIEAALRAVRDGGAEPQGAIVAATHGLFVGACAERLRDLEIAHLFVTDSLSTIPPAGLNLRIVSVAGLLAQAVRRLSATS